MYRVAGKHANRERGQTIVELMVAMSVMIIGLLGTFALLSQTLGLNRTASNQYIAANLAAEGIEVAKNILDRNAILGTGSVAWNEGFTSASSYGVQYDTTSLGGVEASRASSKLRFDQSTGRYSYASGTETQFVRSVRVTPIGTDEIQINSVVRWTDRGGINLEVDVEDHFLNWRKSI